MPISVIIILQKGGKVDTRGTRVCPRVGFFLVHFEKYTHFFPMPLLPATRAHASNTRMSKILSKFNGSKGTFSKFTMFERNR